MLQLSGIGPQALLRERGIEVIHNLEGVGENLSDHVQVGRSYSTSSEHTLNRQVGTIFAQLNAGIKYYLGARNGPLTIGASLAGAYIKTHSDASSPNLHLHFLPFMPGEKGWDLADFSGFRLGMYQARPTSRGRVRITSPDPRASTSVLFNHLTQDEDVNTLMAGMKIARRIAVGMSQAFHVEEIAPGSDADTEDGLLDYIRTTADTGFHYCGTARMGTDDMAVVDPQLRVRGVEGLRVIDASIMPTTTSGNINAAVLMIGEKGAELVKSAA